MSPLTLLIRQLAEDDRLWARLPISWRQSQRFRVQRIAALNERFAARCARLLESSTVKQGPFAGLYMPGATTQGSAHLPRLTGTYESEIHGTIERLIANQPPVFIDVGFAEGYYLVGCGLKSPGTTLVGFDPAPEAHRLCRRLAAANGLPEDRLRLFGACNGDALRQWLPGRSLVLCDCEGFEMDLFSAADASLWAQSDLVIECHDFIRPGAAASVTAVLAPTHRVTPIPTVPPEGKLPLLSSDAFAEFTLDEKLRLLSEGRPAGQVWLVAEAIAQA